MRLFRVFPFVPFFLLLSVTTAHAKTFSDVPSDYLYRDAVESLADKGVIVGYPDGTFRPSYPVSRAAMIKMIYKAINFEPPEPERQCAKDVVAGHWAERFICAALNMNYVQGIGDGNFGPDMPVTRAQALKMILKIFEFDMTLAGVKDYLPPMFDDVKATDWFYNYVNAAYQKTVLPAGGEIGKSFNPNTPLSRGEAAAYINSALRVRLKEQLQQQESQSSAAIVAAASSAAANASAANSSSSRALGTNGSVSSTPAQILSVSVPFTDAQTFDAKKSLSYQFNLQQMTTLDVAVTFVPGTAVSLTCRLYRLEDTGFSVEYYSAYMNQGNCAFLTTLTAGKYQLQLQPSTAGAKFNVVVKTGKGDGNDGFSQAVSLDTVKVRTEGLEAGNLQNYYKFNVSSAGTTGQTMTLQLVSTDTLGCTIYPLDNVDLFGFTEPSCNQSYVYPSGTYVVAVSRDSLLSPSVKKELYTVSLKK